MAAAEAGTTGPRAISEFAPAKVNLFLHLGGRRDDGYHLLESLVVFPQVGDTLGARPAETLSLDLIGPFAAALAAGDNLVLRAVRALGTAVGRVPDVALTLEKRLPVASGIGGGSSDAAAALRLLSRLWDVAVPDALPVTLGADVPVCLAAPRAQLMSGIGEVLAPSPDLPPFWMVLVNPGVPVETAAVFAAVERRAGPPAGPPPKLTDFETLRAWLAAQRNDLEAAACTVCPPIRDALAALAPAPVARMSGSGATCFAIWPTEAAARAQATAIARAHPAWWIAAAPVPPHPMPRP